MKTAVVVTAGRRKGREGFICGPLENRNPHVRKAMVFFAGGAAAPIALDRLAPAGHAEAQLELPLPTQKKAAAGP